MDDQGGLLFCSGKNFCNYSFSREQSSAIMKEQQRTPENRGIRMEQYKVILVDDEVEDIDVMKKRSVGMIWDLTEWDVPPTA